VRYSQAFIPTVKETPADATSASHQLMIRAGLIRQLVSGVYCYLPLGYRVLRKAEQIVREEMDRSGAIELNMPALIPLELFKRTDREEAFGANLIKFPDRHGTCLALGPTHEEVITSLVADHVNSYKQLPLNLYQIQTKFRDEERPKSGVLRTREFLMKDAYSFHSSLEDLDRTYQVMYRTYEQIFQRCGLPVVAVEAESGPIGGSASHEFMVLTDVGEDQIVQCCHCGYAANIERAESAGPDNLDELIGKAVNAGGDGPNLQEVETPRMTTIAQVSEFLNCRPEQMIKTLVYRSHDQVIVALVRGDHDANESKLARAAGVAHLEMADEETIGRATGAAVGFAGPVGLKADKLLIDRDVLTITDGVTGANKTDYHLTGVVPGRDFAVDPGQVHDIRVVARGDKCPRCGRTMDFKSCIELGHVFKLGTKYSEALGANFLDANGRQHPMIMGCYGIGINRILAAVIEISHDEAGIIWPISLAPFEVIIVAVNVSDAKVADVAGTLHEQLERAGVQVLLDDRDVRPGVKFKDADLLGIPVRLTVGPKGLAGGNVEIKLRREKDYQQVPAGQAVQRTEELIRQLREELRGAVRSEQGNEGF